MSAGLSISPRIREGNFMQKAFDFAAGRDSISRPRGAAYPPARARASDPAPSKAAAAEVNESGSAHSLCGLIVEALEAIARRPNLPAPTPGELAEFLNRADSTRRLDSVAISRRMSELREAGLAVSFGDRACAVRKRRCCVWVLAAACCGDPRNHTAARLPDSGFETVQCLKCGRGLGAREEEVLAQAPQIKGGRER